MVRDGEEGRSKHDGETTIYSRSVLVDATNGKNTPAREQSIKSVRSRGPRVHAPEIVCARGENGF